MNCKRKGSRAEHKSMAFFEAQGYRCTRSAATLGAFDIVAIGPTDVVLCQVKTRDWPDAVETEGLVSFPTPPNCRKLVHRWRDGQRSPDVRVL
jgi:Holliday junction resolvase